MEKRKFSYNHVLEKNISRMASIIIIGQLENSRYKRKYENAYGIIKKKYKAIKY